MFDRMLLVKPSHFLAKARADESRYISGVVVKAPSPTIYDRIREGESITFRYSDEQIIEYEGQKYAAVKYSDVVFVHDREEPTAEEAANERTALRSWGERSTVLQIVRDFNKSEITRPQALALMGLALQNLSEPQAERLAEKLFPESKEQHAQS